MEISRNVASLPRQSSYLRWNLQTCSGPLSQEPTGRYYVQHATMQAWGVYRNCGHSLEAELPGHCHAGLIKTAHHCAQPQ